jgi:hypothetical protein
MVIAIDPTAAPFCAQVEAALGDFDVRPDPGYLDRAAQAGLDPIADTTLAQLVPSLGADLVLVPEAANDLVLELEYRDGHNGQSLGMVEVPLSNGALGWAGRRMLPGETRQRLGAVSQGSAGAIDPEAGLGGEATDPEAGLGGEAGWGADDAELDGPTVAELHMSIGTGVGTRSLELTRDSAPQSFDTGPFAALDLVTSLLFRMSRGVALGPSFVYQTSMMHEVTERHLSGAPRTMDIRSHRFEAAALAAFSLGDDADAPVLSGTLGYGVRNLSPEVHHLLTPRYTLSGPFARIGFSFTLAEGFSLRLAPEAQWLPQVGEELRDLGIDGSGLAFGGQAGAAVELSEELSVELSYRESHALLSATEGDPSDVERYITIRLARDL